MPTHHLKTWPEFFADLLTGEKTFELRNDDRKFRIGDQLILQEWDPLTKLYSGRETRRRVIHILRHDPDAACAAGMGLRPGHVIMSLGSISK